MDESVGEKIFWNGTRGLKGWRLMNLPFESMNSTIERISCLVVELLTMVESTGRNGLSGSRTISGEAAT